MKDIMRTYGELSSEDFSFLEDIISVVKSIKIVKKL